MILAYILFFTFLGGMASLVGSWFLVVRRNITESFCNQFVSLAAGILLAVAFLDLLPEAQEFANGANIFIPALLGFITFFFAERFISLFHHHHSHAHHDDKPTTQLVIIGDGVHNFIDGIVITASFLISIPLGITTAIAVAAHEIPQEIADMGILLANGLSKTKALLYNFLSALTAIFGAIAAFYFASFIQNYHYAFLSVAAGFFIYISASDLIPDLHEKHLGNATFKNIVIFVIGILLVFASGSIFKV